MQLNPLESAVKFMRECFLESGYLPSENVTFWQINPAHVPARSCNWKCLALIFGCIIVYFILPDVAHDDFSLYSPPGITHYSSQSRRGTWPQLRTIYSSCDLLTCNIHFNAKAFSNDTVSFTRQLSWTHFQSFTCTCTGGSLSENMLKWINVP